VSNRFLSGPSQQVKGTVDAGVAVQVGDLMYKSGDYVFPADSLNAGLEDNQHAFAQAFVGSAQDQRLASADADGDILINTGGVHRYPCDALSTTWPLGSFVAVDADGFTAGTLRAQKVVPTADRDEAIGYLARNHVVGETTLEFVLCTALDGGIQADA